MIITGDDPQYIAFVKVCLSKQFLMSDLSLLRYFLEIDVFTIFEGFYLSQEKYIELLVDPTRYRHIVGSLVYLDVTRPDISYFVHILSQFVSAPTQLHYNYLLRVLRYLRGTISRHLFLLCSSSLQLQAYSDAIWASDSSDRRSLSAYCVFLGGSLIAWKTKKQIVVSRSSAEAVLRAMPLVTAEVRILVFLFLCQLLFCLTVQVLSALLVIR
uniref:Reverse transcriptase Ty1/copia-type domain-containing protein n=1 Tax=Arundo donax TaxID=35708 RepID=A0A0A9DCA1_ARUDO